MGKMRERWKKSQAATFLAAPGRCGDLGFFFPFFPNTCGWAEMVYEEGSWKSRRKRGQERGEREQRLEAQPRLLGFIQELLGEVPGSFSPAFQLHENHIHSVSGGRGEGMGAANNSAEG